MSFLIPLIGLVTGIWMGSTLTIPGWSVIPILIACVAYFVTLKKSATPIGALKYRKYNLIWISLIFFGIGLIDASYQKPTLLPKDISSNLTLAQGEVKEISSFASGDRLIVDVSHLVDSLERVNKINNLKVVVTTDGFSADIGDIITFPAGFSLITENPNFRPSGYPERMKKRGILYKIDTNEGEIKIKGHNNSIFNSGIAWKNSIISKIEKSSLNRSCSEFIIALLFGDRSFLSDDVKSSFSNAGVAHVLALSGLHVAIVMGIFLSVLFPLKLVGLHRLRYLLALSAVWGYAFITGLSTSTIRACIMISFVVLALCTQRKNSSENALLASAFFILLINPSALFDIGMQLSFLCVGSILMFAGSLNPVNRHHHPKMHSIVAAVLVSLVATASTWVVVAFYFNKIPLLFLPVNLCLLPLLPIYIWISAIYILFLLSGIDITFLSSLLNYGYILFEKLVSYLSLFGESAITANVRLSVVILWLLGILIITYAMKKGHKNKKKVLICGAGVMMVFSIIIIPFINGKSSDSVIFQKNFYNISLALYDGDEHEVSTLPRNTVSRIFHKGCEVLAIDCNERLDSLAEIISKSPRSRKRFLILGSGFKESQLKEIPGIKDFDKIILHSSIKRKMELKLREEALDLGLEAIHSLRDDGPLEEFLPDSLSTIR